MNSKFLVVEGLEGAGKSTAISLIMDELKSHDISDITSTREPGGTILAEKLRALIKDEHMGETLFDKTEMLLFYAARNQLVEGVIKPSLSRGSWVVGDRHDWSTQAYQGGGRGIEQNLIDKLHSIVLPDLKPDLTIFMDVDPEVGLARARGRGELDRIEKSGIDFFTRARARFLQLCQDERNAGGHVIIIDANRDIEEVRKELSLKIKNWLKLENY
ncbi:hypothetical protein VCHA53O466_50384 [Vibrio chagasii]|nr:hypothetical protein VCHA53O466_50384 [Vibrio chagasii]